MDLSALERSISNVERSLDSLETLLFWMTGLVVAGLIIEYWYEIPEEIAKLRAAKRFMWKPVCVIVGGIFITIGVAGELIVQFLASAEQTDLRKLNHRVEGALSLQATEAIDRAKGFDAKIAALNLEAKNAVERASLSDERSRRLEQENIVLSAKMQDRRLSKDQRLALRDKMKGFSVPQSWQVITFSNDGEARGLVVDIQESVVGTNGAGWPVPTMVSDQASMPIRGVRVEFGPNADFGLQSTAKALTDTLRLDKLAEVDGPRPFRSLEPMQAGSGGQVSVTFGSPVNSNATITLIIGRKP